VRYGSPQCDAIARTQPLPPPEPHILTLRYSFHQPAHPHSVLVRQSESESHSLARSCDFGQQTSLALTSTWSTQPQAALSGKSGVQEIQSALSLDRCHTCKRNHTRMYTDTTHVS
jgi:hypothetical protein